MPPKQIAPKVKQPRRGKRIPVLNQRQRLFIEIYVANHFARAYDCAHQAGYSKKDTSVGTKLLRMPLIAAEIQKRYLETRTQVQVEAAHVKGAFAAIAFDPRPLDEGGPTRVERMMALDRIAKLLGLYKIERPGDVGKSLEQLLNEASVVETQLGPPQAPARLRLIDGGRS